MTSFRRPTDQERQAHNAKREAALEAARQRQRQWGQEVERVSISSQHQRTPALAGHHLTPPLDATGSTGTHHAQGSAGITSPGGPPCAHAYRSHGRGSLGDHGKCSAPLRLECEHCGSGFFTPCYSFATGCEHCASLKRGDLKAAVRSGAYGDLVYFGTLTAPGEKPTRAGSRLRWNRSLCGHDPGECSGEKGCKVITSDAAEWHAELGKRWSYFRQMMRRYVSKLAGCDVEAVTVEVIGCWELQKRGALHRHAMFRVDGPGVTPRHVERAFHGFRRWADFGPSYKLDRLDTRDPVQAARCAGYVAKYVAKDVHALSAVPVGFSVTPDASGSLLRRRRFRAWSASRQWGDTLADCRRRRQRWAAGVAGPSGGRSAPLAGAVGARLDPYSCSSTTTAVAALVGAPEGGSM